MNKKFENILKENGILNKKVKETERFYYYCLLKRRVERFGKDALMARNMEEELKLEIIKCYKTLKNLKGKIIYWDKDKVFYESRIYLMTGGTLEKMPQEKGKLFEQIVHYFNDLSHFQKEYYKKFGLKNKKAENSPKENILLKTIITLGLINEQEIENINIALTKTKDETMVYLMKQLLIANKDQKYLTEEKLKEKNKVMYYALKIHFGNLREALKGIKKSYVA